MHLHKKQGIIPFFFITLRKLYNKPINKDVL
jgi:hypothetical protein